MTIQRQYMLPNCNLVLEGLSADATDDPLAPMAMIVNAECQIIGQQGSLKGGRDFLEHLITAVSGYAQEVLSGIAAPERHSKGVHQPVQIKAGEGGYHHLLMWPDTNPSEQSTPLEIKLTTVQLFDLVEAIDQLLADTQTLPDLTLSLKPLSRRYVKPQEPLVQRATPVAIGVSTLAVASVALFLIPTPKFEPEAAGSGSDSSASTPATTAADSTPATEPTADAAAPTSSDAASAASALDEAVNAPPITDADTLVELQDQLSRQLRDAWITKPELEDALSYRVAVSANGDIVGFKYENDAALANVDDTPLPKLAYIPLDPTEAAKEPTAQFRVTFTPEGKVEVEPWRKPDEATSSTPPATPSLATAEPSSSQLAAITTEIRDLQTLETLQKSLSTDIRDKRTKRKYEADLVYRVRLTESGAIAGYEFTDAVSQKHLNSTPLPSLAATDADPDQAMVDFRVVFTADGVLEVSPWKGWPD